MVAAAPPRPRTPDIQCAGVSHRIFGGLHRPSELTAFAETTVYEELARRRCEAVTTSCSWRGAEGVANEVEPGHGGGIVHVEIVEDGA
jgi:hypothetical protein